MTQRSFTWTCLKAKIHSKLKILDLCGLLNVKVQGGYEYFINFVDNYSRFGHVYILYQKSNSLEKFREYKTEVENQ